MPFDWASYHRTHPDVAPRVEALAKARRAAQQPTRIITEAAKQKAIEAGKTVLEKKSGEVIITTPATGAVKTYVAAVPWKRKLVAAPPPTLPLRPEVVERYPPSPYIPRPRPPTKAELLREYVREPPPPMFPKVRVPEPVKIREPPEPLFVTIGARAIREREAAARAEREWLEAYFVPKPKEPFYVHIGKGIAAAVAAPTLMIGEVARAIHEPEFRMEFAARPVEKTISQILGVGKGIVETAIKYPVFTAAAWLTPVGIKIGLKRVGIIKPTYKVTYLRGVAMAREWRMGEAVIMKPPKRGVSIVTYKPPIKVKPTFIFPKEFLVKKPISFAEMVVEKVPRVLRKRVYIEKIKPITVEMVVKKPPKIPEVIPAISIKKITGIVTRVAKPKKIITVGVRREAEMLVPIKLPKPPTFIVKVARPITKPMKPFLPPKVPPVTKIIPKKPPTITKVVGKPRPIVGVIRPMLAPISVKEVVAMPYEYIAPAAAAVVGIRPIPVMERPALRPAVTVIQKQKEMQRTLSAMGVATEVRPRFRYEARAFVRAFKPPPPITIPGIKPPVVKPKPPPPITIPKITPKPPPVVPKPPPPITKLAPPDIIPGILDIAPPIIPLLPRRKKRVVRRKPKVKPRYKYRVIRHPFPSIKELMGI